MRQQINKAKRWVIKVGTSTLTAPDGHFSTPQLDNIVSQVVTLLKKEMKRNAFDDVMDVVLGSQKVIHERSTAAHEDRMNILRQFCGYGVWGDG